jgi:hypothetical protein
MWEAMRLTRLGQQWRLRLRLVRIAYIQAQFQIEEGKALLSDEE